MPKARYWLGTWVLTNHLLSRLWSGAVYPRSQFRTVCLITAFLPVSNLLIKRCCMDRQCSVLQSESKVGFNALPHHKKQHGFCASTSPHLAGHHDPRPLWTTSSGPILVWLARQKLALVLATVGRFLVLEKRRVLRPGPSQKKHPKRGGVTIAKNTTGAEKTLPMQTTWPTVAKYTPSGQDRRNKTPHHRCTKHLTSERRPV